VFINNIRTTSYDYDLWWRMTYDKIQAKKVIDSGQLDKNLRHVAAAIRVVVVVSSSSSMLRSKNKTS
jgi:hypothetical protein